MALGDGLFYMPTRSVYGHPETYALRYESVHFVSEPGVELHGLFFPACGPARGTVVHCHGNAGNITGHFEHVRWLPADGWNVLCFDYRGYGRSGGRPTREGTIVDGCAAVDYVQARPEVDTDRVVLLGQSLGGAVGIVVAVRRPSVRGVAVEGAFSNYRTEAAFISRQNILMRPAAGILARALISDGLDPIDWIARIAPRPTMFICGTSDTIVDYRQTVALHDAAGEPKTLHVIEGGGHADTMLEPKGRGRFLDFFDGCVNGTAM